MDIKQTVLAARDGQKYPIAKLISLFEDTRVKSSKERQQVIELLEKSAGNRRATVIGFTGTPGSGKSTLLGICAQQMVHTNQDMRVCVLAIDPSSTISGGSILGDRTRVKFDVNENRLYFRSQASDLELGGIGRHTYQVCRLLVHLFDVVFIETVGIGQNETEIRNLADRIYLVLQPLGGDQIQFMKAGIMEIPDAFIINKSDAQKEAEQSYHNLKASLQIARPESGNQKSIDIFKTSCVQKTGLDELIADIVTFVQKDDAMDNAKKRMLYFFGKWVRDEYGMSGFRYYATLGPDFEHQIYNSFENSQLKFWDLYQSQFT